MFDRGYQNILQEKYTSFGASCIFHIIVVILLQLLVILKRLFVYTYQSPRTLRAPKGRTKSQRRLMNKHLIYIQSSIWNIGHTENLNLHIRTHSRHSYAQAPCIHLIAYTVDCLYLDPPPQLLPANIEEAFSYISYPTISHIHHSNLLALDY